MEDEIKIIIKPAAQDGFAMFIVEPKQIMSAEMMSCYTLARGMVKFGLETPDIAFDYGVDTLRQEKDKNDFKSNGSKYDDVKKDGNVFDITEIIKRIKK